MQDLWKRPCGLCYGPDGGREGMRGDRSDENRRLPCGSVGKESACNAGDLRSIPGLGRSPGEGNGYPFQYSCLENSMDCIVHRITKSWTRWSNFHFHLGIDRAVSPGPCSTLFRAARVLTAAPHSLARLQASSCDKRLVPVALLPSHSF